MKSTLGLLRNRNLLLLLSGRLVSASGDWLYTVALSVAIYRYSGGNSVSVGLLWIVRLFPYLAIGPFSGGLAGRLGYRRSMILADLVRMVLVAILALALSSSTWLVIYPFALLVTVFSTLFGPASVGLIPSIVDSPDDLLPANALIMQGQSLAIVLGSAVGGAAAAAISIRYLLLVQAATFGVSAFTLLFLRGGAVRSSASAGEVTDEEEAIRGGIKHTIRLIGERPVLLFALAVMALPEFASGAFIIWVVPYSEHSLHLGNAGIGYLYAALGAGKLVGGGVAGAMGSNARLDSMLAGSVVVGGIALAVFGLWPVAVAAILLAALIGGAEIVEYAAQETLLQRSVPEAIIGQASGTMDAFLFNMGLIGNALSGVLAAWFGLRTAMTGLGVLVLVATGLMWWYFRRQTEKRPDASRLAGIPVFEGLSSDMREWAVQRMVRERFPAGAILMRQGDLGDKLYILAGGTVQVERSEDGHTSTRDLGPGTVFGEIALMENVPRTATVRALGTATTYTLSREDFEDLRDRAATFRDSMLELANTRLQQDAGIRLALAAGV